MDQIKRLWDKLSWPQRLWMIVAALAVGGGLIGLSRWNDERDFKPLYSNLAAEDAGALVAKLKEGGIDYRLGDNGATVLVSSARVAEARLAMAAQGLPKSGRIGYELFDKANFGASDFAEQVNYHRAIEGELERSIMSIREVEQARVHVTMAKDSIYTESRQPAKASILIKLRAGARLTPPNVAAICQLAASAVPELAPEQVSLVDTGGNLLNRPRRAASPEDDSEAALDYRKSVEKDLQAKIAATLEPLLGAEHFRAGVSAEVDSSSGDQSEETYDPQKSAVLSSQTSEDGPALPQAAGVPGTASNLPRPTATPVATTAGTVSTGSANYARKTSSTTYQPSRVVRHTKLPQGSLVKLSLAVLVDHTVRFEGARRLVEPPSAEKLKVVHDLVAAAVGISADRGDQLVVEAFPFEATLATEAPLVSAAPPAPKSFPLPPWLEKLTAAKNFALLAAIGAGAMLLLLGGLAYLAMRVRAKSKRTTAEATAAAIAANKARELPPTPEEMQRQIEAQMAEQQAAQARQQAEELMKLKLPVVATKKTEVLTKHISSESKKDPTAMAQVVRSWLNGEDRR
ncbi:MAG TPA: flagellar basal-body MS-ring/collar protein FliF [Bryobacteraceae bacterium]|nr:flagellar basal-body MS-ring/collar protein FliF [Bryobacteraceae bacterium]